MSHTIFWAWAVAVTDSPGTAAVADVGPHVEGDTAVQSHTGSPTRPVFPGAGAIPMSGPVSVIESNAR
jgi:hypothetical protein